MSAGAGDCEDEGTLVLEQRFAIVREWIIDAAISDCPFRLYAVLLRFGQSSGQRSNQQRLTALAGYLHRYNTKRGHTAHRGRPPISALAA